MNCREIKGPFKYNAQNIEKYVTRDSPGNYLLGHTDKKGAFIVRFVGRSANVKDGLKHHLNPPIQIDGLKWLQKEWQVEHNKEFKFNYVSSPKEAYENLCRDYHQFGGSQLLDNRDHPHPGIEYVKCPVCPIFDHLLKPQAKRAKPPRQAIKTGRIIHFRTPGVYKADIEQVKFPAPGPGEVLVRVRACNICGSGHKPWGGYGRYIDAKYPDRSEGNPSHMVAGEIEEVGKGVRKLKVGDRVTLYYRLIINGEARTINGGYADYITVAQELCLVLPQQIDFIEGSMLTDLFGTIWNRVKEANVKGAKVCVWGCGPMGLAALQEAKAFGAKWVASLDIIPFRREMAKKMGADMVIDPSSCDAVKLIKKITHGGAEACIVTSAVSPSSAQMAMDSLAEGGRYSSAGISPDKVLKNRFVYPDSYYSPADMPDIVELVLEGKLRPKALVTHIFPLDKIGEAYYTRFKKQNEALSVIVVP